LKKLNSEIKISFINTFFLFKKMIKFIGKTAGKLYKKVVNRAKSTSNPIFSLKIYDFLKNSSKDQCDFKPQIIDFYFEKRRLPENFAENLLNLEIELEQGKYTIKNINDLLQLYSVMRKSFVFP